MKHEVDGCRGHVRSQIGVVALHYFHADVQHYVRHVDVMIAVSGYFEIERCFVLITVDWLVFDYVLVLDAGLRRFHGEKVTTTR